MGCLREGLYRIIFNFFPEYGLLKKRDQSVGSIISVELYEMGWITQGMWLAVESNDRGASPLHPVDCNLRG